MKDKKVVTKGIRANTMCKEFFIFLKKGELKFIIELNSLQSNKNLSKTNKKELKHTFID